MLSLFVDKIVLVLHKKEVRAKMKISWNWDYLNRWQGNAKNNIKQDKGFRGNGLSKVNTNILKSEFEDGE